MWEGRLHIYGTPRVPNNFPFICVDAHIYRGNYCILLEYHKCILPPLTWMVGPTN